MSIEVPAEVPPVLAAMTVRACDATLGSGRCRLSRDNLGTTDSAWLATVAASEDFGSFRIELGSTQPRQVQIRFSRTLEFEANEPEPRRWSTVGVVVAALVIDASASTVSAAQLPAPDGSDAPRMSQAEVPPSSGAASVTPPPSHPPSAAPPKTKNPTTQHTYRREARLAVQATYSRTNANSNGRVGVHALPSLMLSGPVFGWSGVGLAVANRSVISRVWSGTVGLGLASGTDESGLGIEGRLGFSVDLSTFSVERGNEADHAARWRYGPVAGMDLRLGLTRALELLVSVNGAILSPTVQVNVGGSSVDQLGALQGSAGIGLRARFGL